MKLLLTAVLLTLAFASSAQDAADEKMYQAYLTLDKVSWKKAVEMRALEAKQTPADAAKQFKLAFAQFSLLSSTMATKDETLFDEYLDTTKELLKILIEKKEVAAESKALLSAIYGLQIGYSPMKGIMLGGKSSSLAEEGKKPCPYFRHCVARLRRR